jgi:Cu(I)/Ag(I) efflux system membrane fusion protein
MPFFFFISVSIVLTFFSASSFAEGLSTHESAHDSSHEHAEKLLPLTLGDTGSAQLTKYVCPMHPQIIRDHEGSCPICGMDLVQHLFDVSEESPSIRVSQSAIAGVKQGFSVRTTRVQKTRLWKYIPTFGRVVANKAEVEHIHPRAIGWISHLGVSTEGDYIKKGVVLYRIYSPEMVSAQQDLLLALKTVKKRGNKSKPLLESARSRLRLLGIADSVIRLIERRKKVIHDLPFYSPRSGYVQKLIVKDGMFIRRETQLMQIEDYTTVWVEAEILPLQQGWIKKGLTSDIKTDSFSNQRWESRIDYIYPMLDAQSQAMKVRLPVINKDGKLKPNMLVNVEIYGGPKQNVLAIPQEAVIDDGEEKRVVVQQEDGLFQVKKVVTGMVSRDIVEIHSGLNEGDKIVLSGQFLIDSESQIQANLRRLLTVE